MGWSTVKRQHAGDRRTRGDADTGEPGDERGLDGAQGARGRAHRRDRRAAEIDDDHLEEVGVGMERGQAGGQREGIAERDADVAREQLQRLHWPAQHAHQVGGGPLHGLGDAAPERRQEHDAGNGEADGDRHQHAPAARERRTTDARLTEGGNGDGDSERVDYCASKSVEPDGRQRRRACEPGLLQVAFVQAETTGACRSHAVHERAGNLHDRHGIERQPLVHRTPLGERGGNERGRCCCCRRQHPRPMGAGHGVHRLAELAHLGQEQLYGESESGHGHERARPHPRDLGQRLVFDAQPVGDVVAQLGDHTLTTGKLGQRSS